jgi:RecB family exonuclease
LTHRTTLIVEGPLALRMQRLAAARSGAIGREIMTLPQLAVRLAGGLSGLPGAEALYPAIRAGLDQGGFAELDAVRSLPGTPRAITRALDLIWRADLDLAARRESSPRLADLALLEHRIASALPPGKSLPRPLRDTALTRVFHAPTVTGPVHIEGLIDIDPIWRPLVTALAATVEITWSVSDETDRSWFPGSLVERASADPAEEHADLCADPRAEAVEALRWMRELLSRGDIAASDIAVAANSPDTWDDDFLVLSRQAGLPLHFSHGVPALSTPDGQACAALADILVHGINQQRVRRLVRRLRSGLREQLPDDWHARLPRSAGLFTVDHWARALSGSGEGAAVTAGILVPILEVLSRGPGAAEEAGPLLLKGQSRLFWDEALRIAPAEAIALSLTDLRVPDGRDPGNSVVWCPASHLATSSRPMVRLLGLNSGSWPRAESEDPIIPEHVIARRCLESVSLTERDRRMLHIIKANATRGLWLSRARRRSSGSLHAPSSLWPSPRERILTRTRVPVHAYSESDRLLARPSEAAQSPLVLSSRQCWRDWQRSDLTAHDAVAGAGQPALERALARVQSATSIRRLLRDPIGFVWYYALGWRTPEFEQQPLSLPPAEFGELVHELIRATVQALEPEPGFARATDTEIGVALNAAAAAVTDAWPLERAVPPELLWRHTVEQARTLTLRGLTIDERLQPGARSWAEIAFGAESADSGIDAPWRITVPVSLGDTGIRIGGRIDRLDLRADGNALRISDYKSGIVPKDTASLVLGRGTELQRALYAVAAHALLPHISAIVSRLVYLKGDVAPLVLRGEELDEAIVDVTRFVAAARRIVITGHAAPGPDARERYYAMRLALPADADAYLQRKQSAFAHANAGLSDLWSRR